MLIRKLFRTAWRYKAQFLSMIIMITIGTGVFLGFNIEWRSIEKNVVDFAEATSYADYRLYADNGFGEEDIRAIQQLAGVKEATRYLNVNVGIKDTKKALALNVSENYKVSTMLVTEGAEYDETGEGIWLSDKFARANDIAIGDTLILTYADMEFESEVMGLAKSAENMICVANEEQLMPDFNSFGFAYISPVLLQKLFGADFYPQINLISDMEKDELEEQVKEVLGRTVQVISKEVHLPYAGAMGEVEEGKAMCAILPELFLAIAILTMVTTMHRIAANEKVQIGTLKALGFRDKRILRHYTCYGLLIGVFGAILGVAVGYFVASLIVSADGFMGTYLDLPDWSLEMPTFCIPVIIAMVVLLVLISYFSVRRMLVGTAAEALRPYAPRAMKKSVLEKLALWEKLSFSTKWNVRDVLRHKSRSAMTLIGVIGCMVLLVGGLGMKDTMDGFMHMLDEDINNYASKITLSDSADRDLAEELAKKMSGDWQANVGISCEGKTVSLEIYHAENEKIRFLDKHNDQITLSDEGAYLCLRLSNLAQPGEIIEISPYGSGETYRIKVAGYVRSLTNECIMMTDAYADSIGIEYHISAIYTDEPVESIESTAMVSGKQDKAVIMDSYDTFMELMNLMVLVLVLAAVILGIVVLYNLGVMSYVERYRELATLKVLGYRDKHIGRLLIGQNVWLTLLGIIIGFPAGVGVLYALIVTLADEYELSLKIGVLTYTVSILVTFGVSLAVGLMVAARNKKINMVEALKSAE